MDNLQEIHYYPIFAKIYYWLLGIAIVALIVIFRINFVSIVSETWYVAFLKMCLASTVPLSIIYRLLQQFRPLLKSTFTYQDGQVVVSRGKNISLVDSQQISLIKISKIPTFFGGGFKWILKSGQVFHFPSFIRNNYVLLEWAIKQNKEIQLIGDKESYLQRAQNVSQSWSRMKPSKKSWIWFALKFVLMPCFLSVAAVQLQTESKPEFYLMLINFFLLNLMIAGLVFTLQEVLIVRSTSSGWVARHISLTQFLFQGFYVLLSGALFYGIIMLL